jgi:hypothetical protein
VSSSLRRFCGLASNFKGVSKAGELEQLAERYDNNKIIKISKYLINTFPAA